MVASRNIGCFLRQGFPEWNIDVTKCQGTEKEMVVTTGVRYRTPYISQKVGKENLLLFKGICYMGARYIERLFVTARILSEKARRRCYWLLVEL